MKKIIFTLCAIITAQISSLALETSDLLGNFYSEGWASVSSIENNLRLFTFGGPSKGKWFIKDNELHQTTDKTEIDFFSSAIENFTRADFQKIIIDDRDTVTIYSAVSVTKDKLVFKDKEDDILVTYIRRKPKKAEPSSWEKPLISLSPKDLGNPPSFDHTKKQDLAGERFRRLSKFHLDYDGFKFATHLPTLKARGIKGKLRSKEEIADRILCNYLSWAFVYISEKELPTAAIKTYLKRHKLNSKLTKKEKEVFTSDRKNAEVNYGNSIGWKLENTWALAWVLGFEYDIDIDQIPIGDAVAPALGEFMSTLAKDKQAFLKTCKMRSLTEILQTEDIFYCTHNAVRSAQVGTKGTIPKGFHPTINGGVIHEKRHSLTWVLSPGTSWDDTGLDT